MRKVFRNGNSLAVTVPKEYAEKLNIKEGSNVDWTEADNGIVLTMEKAPKAASQIDPKVAKLIEKISKKYVSVWQELSKT